MPVFTKKTFVPAGTDIPVLPAEVVGIGAASWGLIEPCEAPAGKRNDSLRGRRSGLPMRPGNGLPAQEFGLNLSVPGSAPIKLA